MYTFKTRPVGKQPTRLTTLHHMVTGFYDPAEAVETTPIDGKLLPLGQPILKADGSLQLPGAKSPVPAAVVKTLNESPALIMITQGKPEVFHLKPGKRLRLGREKNCDIVLADIAASRLHAEVLHGPDGIYIRDRESSNGVLVNRTKIDNPYRLAHGDRIMIGSIILYFINQNAFDESPAREQARMEARPASPSEAESSVCPNCGTSNTRIARFCANCGTPLGMVAARLIAPAGKK
jgi:hypothetical protein